ncbi:MFS transporter [Portibacter lacus]|uniref:MFS transporter n=1 Tax=Portibacter lacus TaxID=1099794 RepID=A0AA37SNE1_9BACT|nr:MFS transporter [Portibacter lacus]GLR16254.1 MFS transporter [Portibacter lacus]
MIGKFYNFYVNSFKGLSKEIWLLSAAFLVNRAGTMVIPFIAIYMTQDLGFDLIQVGWIMSFFGLGSLAGSWLGGKLTDIFSYYKVMVMSLAISGIGFVLFYKLKSFEAICIGMFVLITIADSFRPAAFTAIDAYSKPENKVRSISLIRLAINLGYSIGPAIGGVIYYAYGAQYLFYIDGFTCFASSIFTLIVLAPKKILSTDEEEIDIKPETIKSVWNDRPYLTMMGILFLFNLAFFQLFVNVPLFYREVYLLNEKSIGYIMALNGVVIFLLEMPLVNFLELKKAKAVKVVLAACVLISISYLILNVVFWVPILIVSMLFLTFAEMLGFPFSNSWALNRAPKGRVGQYMGLYTGAFALSHIIGPNLGMRISQSYGYDASWYVMGGLGIAASLMTLYLLKSQKKLGLS